MNIRQFICRYEAKHPHSYFFNRETLACFGEKLSAMKVRKTKDGSKYVIIAKQKGSPYPSQLAYHVFDAKTLEDIETEYEMATIVSKYGKLISA